MTEVAQIGLAGLLNPDRVRQAQLRSLAAPTFAALHAAGLNLRPLLLGKELVGASLAQGRQFVHVLNARQLGSLYGFSDSDVADVLNGYVKGEVRMHGLIELGFVRRVLLPLDRGWLLVVNPNHARWAVGRWVHSAAEKARWLADLDAQARELGRQVVSAEWEWQYPDMAALLSDGDVEAALGLANGGVAAVGRDALNSSGAKGTVVGRAACPIGDAPNVVRNANGRSDVGSTSEFPKSNHAENGANGPEVRNFRREQLTVKQEPGTETVQQLNCSHARRVNGLLVEIEAQFARAHGPVAARQEMMRSGRAWRKRCVTWPDLVARETAALKCHIDEGKSIGTAAWFYLSHYILRSLGARDWEAGYASGKKKETCY